MIVTELVEETKSRMKVYIDQEFAFVLYKGELRKYGLKKDQEISEDKYKEITTEILPKRAKLRTMNLLQSKDYTRAQLKKKLIQGGYPENIAEEALDYVASYKYIDDLRYAKDYITCSQESRSRRRIENDLRNRGIPQDILTRAWMEWDNEGNTLNEDEQIRKLLEKKHFNKTTAEQKEIQRMYGFLGRKGFDLDKIRKALFCEKDYD